MSPPKQSPDFREVDLQFFDQEFDLDCHRELFGFTRCFKCGSRDFEEPLDVADDVIVCCDKCPEENEHH